MSTSPLSHRRTVPVPDPTPRQHLPQRAVALLLAGGHDAGRRDAVDGLIMPTVHFGGKFRTVDFALSNCVNSGIRRVGVITQYKSHSLLRHLQRGWDFLKRDANEFVELLPAQACVGGVPSYCGSAGAVTLNRDILEGYGAEFVVVLGGDRIYKMNYAAMLADHVAKGCECTVACVEVPRDQAPSRHVMAVDAQSRITAWLDTPTEPPVPGSPSNPEVSLVSMGIYIFNAGYLYAELARDRDDETSSHDFARDIIAHAVRGGNAAAHPFAQSCVGTAPGASPYWRDVGTIDSFWSANIDLTATEPLLDLYDTHWPIRTYHAELAPAKFLHNQPDRRGMAVESLVAGGSIISGSVLRSVLFSAVRVHSYASVEWSVLLPEVKVGRRARLRRVVVERGCSIPDGLVIGEDPDADAQRFVRSHGGITLVTAERLARLSPEPCATS